MTVSQIRENHPEFADHPSDAAISAAIAQAEAYHDATVLGGAYDTAVELWVCHLLAISPHGAAALLTGNTPMSIYYETWANLVRSGGNSWRIG